MQTNSYSTLSPGQFAAQTLKAENSGLSGCILAESHADGPAENPICLNAVSILFCLSGRIRLSSDSCDYCLEPGSAFVSFPGQAFQIGKAENAETMWLVMETGFIKDLALDLTAVTCKFLQIRDTRQVDIAPGTFAGLKRMLHTIGHELNCGNDARGQREIVRYLLLGFLMKFAAAISQTGTSGTTPEKPGQTSDSFRKFISLLNEHYRTQHSAAFYAEKLHLSVKYFTTLIKKASGRSVTEWINDCLILDAKNLLRYSDLNVQEIAYRLNFSNQSFFGKFFKHHTGMSPSAYRKVES